MLPFGLVSLCVPFPVGSETNPRPLYEKSWAVVIGINQYAHWPHLQAAVADAQAVAERLKSMGFEQIVLLRNAEATRTRILTEIGTSLSRSTGPNDRVVIYFAGHGFTEELPNGEQVGYIIPVDCPQSNFFTHAISMQQIRETFSRMRAKHIYYVMDCCFSGYGFSRGAGVLPETRGYLQAMTERRSVQMITAGRKGDLAHEQGGHGIFTLYLLRGLQGEADLNNDGVVTASELGAFVQPNVYQASSQKQLPQYGRLDGEGEVVFVVGEDPRLKQAKERLEALEKEMAQLQDQRRALEGKKELLLADIMKLDVEIRQLKERSSDLEKEAASLKAALQGQGRSSASGSPAAAPRPSQAPPQPASQPSANVAGPPAQAVPIPGARFIDNGNGSITDTRTGLVWEKSGSSRPMNYNDAKQYVRQLNESGFCGYTDWRIPEIHELRGLLLDEPVGEMRLDPTFDRRITNCWSSTEYQAGRSKHYTGIDLKDGTTLTRSEHSESYHVRAVRGPEDSLKARKGI
jgi:uncharacterized caspase-like protein